MMLTDIVGKWCMDKYKSKLSPMKIPILIKEENNREDYINQNLKKAHQYWNDWKFQINWNKLKWFVPKSCYMKETLFVNLPTSFI